MRAVEVFPDPASLAEAAAVEIARRIGALTAARPGLPVSVGLSGGNTPRPVYELLAGECGRGIAWERVHVFWGDERFVPHDSPFSNYRMAREALLDRIAIPASNVHPIQTSFADPRESALDYERTLAGFFGSPMPALDINILGLGDDGHTASLFPGTDSLNEREHAVTVAHAAAEPRTRITLTFPALNRSAATLFLTSGAAKHRILRAILDTPHEARTLYPAAMLEPAGEVVWMVDRAAREGNDEI